MKLANSPLMTLLLMSAIISSDIMLSTAYARDNNQSLIAQSEATADSAESKEDKNDDSRTVLQGGVRGSAVRLEEGLGMVEMSSKMVQSSALEIAKEVTRKETVTVRGPNYIGNGIVIPAIGGPNGTMQLGDLPARKEKVERFIVNAEESIKALKSQVDGLIIPEGSAAELSNLWRGMQSTMKVAETNIGVMRDLSAQTPSGKEEINKKDSKQIGRAALKVYDSMTALDKMRTQMFSILEPTGKSKE